ncbi:hypothetical protein [Microbacterium sediminis]|uniref:Uncharacterized protein n=1 Tax=Microbacterium sediminis TaxID=904291 RepID=A0A1B9NCL2_9MICO|nr:hypothetical protein [Microbacterium sediminis]OCG74341.1 hypothetical protein A7J15_05750 [Microbacterium sediminis]QBR73704.1 hypothetical protein E3O41_04225 [Microbacterium sediminis]
MTEPTRSRRISGIGTILVWVYGVLALAATGRSVYQMIAHFSQAPLPYLLSALAAVVYVLATAALVVSGSAAWYRVAWAAVSFELAGVLVVGTLSVMAPDLFHADDTVWSGYGAGYYWIPLVLPFLGIWWLATHRPAPERATASSPAGVAG